MTVTRTLLICALTSCMVVSSGCKRLLAQNCNKPQAYAAAQDMPPLKIPVGLDGPDTRTALKIPALNEPEAPRAVGAPCLDEPPALTAAKPAPTGAR
jgi:uncharacterized lipoprotein